MRKLILLFSQESGLDLGITHKAGYMLPSAEAIYVYSHLFFQLNF